METEKEIIRDIWIFLKNHHNPPAIGTETCIAFWKKAVEDITNLVEEKWNKHPLAMELGIAVCGYLDKKCKSCAT